MTIILGYRETGLTMMEKDIVVARLVAHAILLDQILRSRLSKQLCLATDNPCGGRTREVTEDCHVFSFLLEVSSGIIMMEDQSQAQKRHAVMILFRGSKQSTQKLTFVAPSFFVIFFPPLIHIHEDRWGQKVNHKYWKTWQWSINTPLRQNPITATSMRITTYCHYILNVGHLVSTTDLLF